MDDYQVFISCRQTQRGDWIVCEALPASMGVGIAKVGSPAGGYTTGAIYSRHATEEACRTAAETLAAQKGYTVVEWAHARSNRRFIDLPRQYPTQQARYTSFDAARDDGWIHVNPAKTIENYRGYTICCMDITPPPNFGYKLAIACAGIQYIQSTTVWADEDGPMFSPMFRTGDLVDAIEAARAWVDANLITQAEAARRLGLTTQAIHNATRDGRLRTYRNDDAANPRQGMQLVSWQQCRQVWGIA